MSIIAIVSAGSGTMFIEEFREAVDAQSAVDTFVNEYNPPKDAADYVGFVTSFEGKVSDPPIGARWSYNHTSGELTDEGIKGPDIKPETRLMSPDGSFWGVSDAGLLVKL